MPDLDGKPKQMNAHMSDICLDLLKRIAVFGGLTQDSLEFLMSLATHVEIQPDEYFFREGDDAEAFYILETGRVAVIKRWHDRQFLLSKLTAGSCFGEMALIEMHQRNASVLAVQPSKAICIELSAMYQLYQRDLEQFTVLQMNLGREVSRRLREANQQIFECRVRMNKTTEVPTYPEFYPPDTDNSQ